MMRPLGALGAVAAVLLTVVGVDALGDLTQNRPDQIDPDSVATVVYDVDVRDYTGGEAAAAQSLWAVCQATIGGEKSVVTATGDAYSVTVRPAFGENGRKRLTGCLEDATVDRVWGHLVSLTSD
jgi:hypothetical protein